MPIDRDVLADDEEVLVDLRPHWIFLFGPLLLTLIALTVALAVVAEFPKAPTAVAWILALMVLVPAGWLVGRAARWYGISLILTNQRLILRRGLLGRDVVQLRLNRVSEVHSTQSPMERILGSGRLVVEVFGESQSVVVDDVRRPKSLQRVLTNQLDDLGSAGDEPTPPRGVQLAPPLAVPTEVYRPSPSPDRIVPSSPSIAEQLIQLDDLRRRGIVTEAEFEAKKSELLGRF